MPEAEQEIIADCVSKNTNKSKLLDPYCYKGKFTVELLGKQYAEEQNACAKILSKKWISNEKINYRVLLDDSCSKNLNPLAKHKACLKLLQTIRWVAILYL